jgi:hypothetical protein
MQHSIIYQNNTIKFTIHFSQASLANEIFPIKVDQIFQKSAQKFSLWYYVACRKMQIFLLNWRRKLAKIHSEFYIEMCKMFEDLSGMFCHWESYIAFYLRPYKYLP